MANNSSDNLTVCVEEAADLNQEFIYAAVLISVSSPIVTVVDANKSITLSHTYNTHVDVPES